MVIIHYFAHYPSHIVPLVQTALKFLAELTSSHRYSVKEKQLCEFILTEIDTLKNLAIHRTDNGTSWSISKTEPELKKPYCYIKGRSQLIVARTRFGFDIILLGVACYVT